MTPDEIKKAIKAKIVELEIAMSLNRTQTERLKVYKELKELQYKLVRAQHSFQETV